MVFLAPSSLPQSPFPSHLFLMTTLTNPNDKAVFRPFTDEATELRSKIVKGSGSQKVVPRAAAAAATSLESWLEIQILSSTIYLRGRAQQFTF